MNVTHGDIVSIMSTDECWDLLSTCKLGRLAVTIGGQADIFPVNHVVHERRLLFRTAPGSKLAELAANPRVAFEVDRYDDSQAASVVVKGVAERLEQQDEIDDADALELTPWIPTLKHRWVRITPLSVTGRRFERGPEPDRFELIDVDDES